MIRQQGRFARPGTAEQTDDLPIAQREIDIFQHSDLARAPRKTAAHTVNCQDRLVERRFAQGV
jgi:hypothetical protein